MTTLSKNHVLFTTSAGAFNKPRPLALRPMACAIATACAAWAVQAHSENAIPTHDSNHVAMHAAPEAALPSIEVTATGLGHGVHDMAAPVTVMEGATWALQRSATLGASLEGEPGIHATHFGAGASRPIVRGMEGPRVGVLSNGSPLHDASTLSPDHAVAIEPLLVHQVEVLRGPAALVHGGAVGGVVNVVDQKIPTAAPINGYEGTAEISHSSAASANNAALGITAGSGSWVWRVEAAGRNAGDYRVGGGWRAEDATRSGRVPGSYSDGQTGSLGLSWVGDQGYVGAAYTRQAAQYGITGHEHEDCHLHGSQSIHCGHHGPQPGHNHTHHEHHAAPHIDLTSHRWDVRGQWRHPVKGIEALEFSGSHTRYGHTEQDEGEVGTAFSNRAHDLRWQAKHAPVGGLRGVLGVSSGQRHFSAQGQEAYVPATRTQQQGVFVLEEYAIGDWRWQGAMRHDRQTVLRQRDGTQRAHSATSLSLGTVWQFTPGWQATAAWSRASRLPSAEELFANGMHIATRSWEIGNAHLGKETNHAWDLGMRKLAGATTWQANVYQHRMQGYIYGRTVHADHGVQLQHYTQDNAKFTGLEGQVRQRLNRWSGITVFGDVVRARLSDGSALPRIPAARAGLRLDATWKGWEGEVEWVQVSTQKRHTAYETATSGYGMLNMTALYQWGTSPVQLMLKAENLTNRLAYAHTSAIKQHAPLKGRNITVGLRMAF